MITLATLPQATAQQVYDQVKVHLLKQGKRSIHKQNDLLCMYRGASGSKCAAGCLIGDGEYTPKLEERTWPELVADGKVPASHTDLISDLQGVHDTVSPPAWESCLIKVAKDHNLTP